MKSWGDLSTCPSGKLIHRYLFDNIPRFGDSVVPLATDGNVLMAYGSNSSLVVHSESNDNTVVTAEEGVLMFSPSVSSDGEAGSGCALSSYVSFPTEWLDDTNFVSLELWASFPPHQTSSKTPTDHDAYNCSAMYRYATILWYIGVAPEDSNGINHECADSSDQIHWIPVCDNRTTNIQVFRDMNSGVYYVTACLGARAVDGSGIGGFDEPPFVRFSAAQEDRAAEDHVVVEVDQRNFIVRIVVNNIILLHFQISHDTSGDSLDTLMRGRSGELGMGLWVGRNKSLTLGRAYVPAKRSGFPNAVSLFPAIGPSSTVRLYDIRCWAGWLSDSTILIHHDLGHGKLGTVNSCIQYMCAYKLSMYSVA